MVHVEDALGFHRFQHVHVPNLSAGSKHTVIALVSVCMVPGVFDRAKCEMDVTFKHLGVKVMQM